MGQTPWSSSTDPPRTRSPQGGRARPAGRPADPVAYAEPVAGKNKSRQRAEAQEECPAPTALLDLSVWSSAFPLSVSKPERPAWLRSSKQGVSGGGGSPFISAGLGNLASDVVSEDPGAQAELSGCRLPAARSPPHGVRDQDRGTGCAHCCRGVTEQEKFE